MITVMLDNDISGYCSHLNGTLRILGWHELDLVRFVTMEEAGLATNSKDREVWRFCQTNGFILLTGNRNKDDDTSLTQTLLDENTETSLPVLTVTNKNRLGESDYRQRCVDRLMNIIFDLDRHVGTGRQYVP